MALFPQRNKLIGAVHAAKKSRGLDDDTYRAMLHLVIGKTSAKDATDAELGRVLDHLNGGRAGGKARGRASSGVAKKVRALWLSLHGLGLVSDPSEKALKAWVKRQYQVDDLAFVRGADSFAVIEGLKQWATRGGVDWAFNADPRRCILAAQWERLAAAGAAPALDLSSFAAPITRQPSVAFADDAELDKVILALGELVRGLNG